jgi:hypothetical protein
VHTVPDSERRYLVTGFYAHRTRNVPVGTKVFVLFLDKEGRLGIATRTGTGVALHLGELPENIGDLRVEAVIQQRCPAAAWRWARATREECVSLVERCTELRSRTTGSQ